LGVLRAIPEKNAPLFREMGSRSRAETFNGHVMRMADVCRVIMNAMLLRGMTKT